MGLPPVLIHLISSPLHTTTTADTGLALHPFQIIDAPLCVCMYQLFMVVLYTGSSLPLVDMYKVYTRSFYRFLFSRLGCISYSLITSARVVC